MSRQGAHQGGLWFMGAEARVTKLPDSLPRTKDSIVKAVEHPTPWQPCASPPCSH